MTRCDVLVVGAGPAGVSAAIHLTRAGKSVIVIDKATFPRDKCCGDGLTTAALRRLEALGFDPRTLPSWKTVDATIWRSPSGHTIHLDVPHDGGIRVGVAKRVDLDAALVTHARAAGIDIREATALKAAQVDESRISVDAGDETFDASYVVGADGMYSPLRRALAPKHEAYLGEIHAFRQYFENVDGPAAEELWVSFEPDLLPGYVWSFPLGDGRANVGFGIERQPGKSVQWMRDIWPDILQRPHVREALGDNATPSEPHKAWPIPARIRPEMLTAANGRVLFVGDAARAVDPLTGEGIAQALETGELAADAIAQEATPYDAANRYRTALRRGLQFDNRFAASLARIVRHERGARFVIQAAPRGPFRGRYAIRWVFEDNPRAALLTPWRWRERFKSKPTAFASKAS